MGETATEAGRAGRRHTVASVRHAREDRKAWWGGMAASAVLHSLILLLWVGEAPELEGASRGGPNREPAVGGGGLRSVQVSMPERTEITPPPKPVVAVDVPEVELREVEVAQIGGDLLPVGRPSPLPGLGGGPGQGTGGDGSGDGYTSPVPRSVVPHWDPPGSVRGLEVTVRVFVDATGRPSLVELDPPTPDDGFNREIMRQARAWDYRPAQRHGVAVEGWAEITFIF